MFVVCAPLTRGGAVAFGPGTTPVTWVAGPDALVAAARGGADAAGLALELESGWLTSRQTLRDVIGRVRRAVPDITAAVIRGGAARHHDLLAGEGIRVALVDSFADGARRSRRPAPAGWACRNVAWGLWEVLATTGRLGPWRWLRGPRGALDVLRLDEATASRLRRRLDWTARRVARGDVAARLADLPALIERRQPWVATASVLKAA